MDSLSLDKFKKSSSALLKGFLNIRKFEYLSFRTKFFLSSFLVTVLMPVIAGWAIYNQDIKSTKELIRSNITNQIDNLSLLIYPSLVFDDEDSAFDLLKGFSTNPMVENAAIWKKNISNNEQITLFSLYPAGQLNILKPRNFANDNLSDDDAIIISRVITSDKEKLGVISVTRSLKDLNVKKADYLRVGILTTSSIFIIIVLIIFWYQSSLTRPLKELSSVAEKISHEKNYSIRANKTSMDEFGSLTDVFNEMLDSLQDANYQLKSANEEMELRVQSRTKELTLSNQRIVAEMSEKEIATQELIKTKDQLNQREKLANVGQVSSNIAHELRNPLSAIRNSTYFLRLKLKKNHKLDEHLNIIDHEISRSDEVIERLLEMTKGKNLKKTLTDVETLAKEAMSYADISKSSRLIINFSPKPFLLSLDKLLFRQVLFNLFLNSIQAMPQGGKIEMNITQRSINGINIVIADEGKGIADNRLEKVFDPLYTDKVEGVGLGLSLCRDLITRHGGTIVAKSKNTNGTIFEIDLPPV